MNTLKIGLLVVTILLIVSAGVNVYLFTQDGGIITDTSGSDADVAQLQSQIASLQNEINSLKEAKLVTRLGAMDERPLFGTSYLHVFGSVINVGTNPASNCRLHVVLYQGQTVAKDTYINLGTIFGEGYVDIDESVYYEGSELTNWQITPELG